MAKHRIKLGAADVYWERPGGANVGLVQIYANLDGKFPMVGLFTARGTIPADIANYDLEVVVKATRKRSARAARPKE